MSLIKVKHASFSYDSIPVFKNINFQVNQGEIFCVVGPNGCGKTTLLDSVLGILSLNKGEIFLQESKINSISPQDIARQVAYVPQNHVRTFPYTVIEIVLMGRASHTGLFQSPSAEDKEIAEHALNLVGLSKYKDRPYTRLSGGEGQLVMIARALAQRTPLIIMDEPTAHLDFRHELIVLETIVQLVKKTNLSVIMATHFPNHAFYFENTKIPTSVALMNQKTFSKLGQPSEVLTEDNLKTLYNINAKIVSCSINNLLEIKQIIPLSTISEDEVTGRG